MRLIRDGENGGLGGGGGLRGYGDEAGRVLTMGSDFNVS